MNLMEHWRVILDTIMNLMVLQDRFEEFEVLAAVVLKVAILWVVVPCNSYMN
jgi:hypothetical protein